MGGESRPSHKAIFTDNSWHAGCLDDRRRGGKGGGRRGEEGQHLCHTMCLIKVDARQATRRLSSSSSSIFFSSNIPISACVLRSSSLLLITHDSCRAQQQFQKKKKERKRFEQISTGEAPAVYLAVCCVKRFKNRGAREEREKGRKEIASHAALFGAAFTCAPFI